MIGGIGIAPIDDADEGVDDLDRMRPGVRAR